MDGPWFFKRQIYLKTVKTAGVCCRMAAFWSLLKSTDKNFRVIVHEATLKTHFASLHFSKSSGSFVALMSAGMEGPGEISVKFQ